MVIVEYKILSPTPELTQSLASDYARFTETLRPEGAVWALELNGERGRGKSTFANAFAAAVMEKYADALCDKGSMPERAKKADYISDQAKVQIRCGDRRAGLQDFMKPRLEGYGGYDVIEHGWTMFMVKTHVDFGSDETAERSLVFDLDHEIERNVAFEALMKKYSAQRIEREIGFRLA